MKFAIRAHAPPAAAILSCHAGAGWTTLPVARATCDLGGTPAYDPCVAAIVSGYREYRALPDAHLSLLPAFFLARLLSYIGWCANKPHMPQTAVIAPLLLAALEQQAPALLSQ